MYGFIVLAAYTALMLAVTVCLSRKSKTAESFHVADRKIGMVRSAMNIAATWIWAPALFTSAKKAYTNGWPGLFWFLVPNVVCLLVFVPFGKKMRKQAPEGITLSGYMRERYHSKSVHGVYLFELAALSVLSSAVQLLAGAKILAGVTGWPFWLLTVVLAAIAFSYSQYSGIKASVLTDTIQMVFMLVCCVLLEPMKAILKQLIDEGKTVSEIGKQLGMKAEEIFRLSDFSRDDFLEMMTKGVAGYSKAKLYKKV